MSLEAFGVKNLRCLTDTGLIPLKPITLLVGRNSSGKSTFLRTFPLLRQSVENARSSPILWEHPDYVDFGNLDLAINDRAADRAVTFAFAGELEADEYSGRCELEMAVAASVAGPYVRSYDLGLERTRARLLFDEERRLVHVDGMLDDATRDMGLRLGGFAHIVASLQKNGGGQFSYRPYVDNGLSEIEAAKVSFPVDAKQDDISFVIPALYHVDEFVAQFMYRVAYLGPQRAMGDRLYRLRDVAVEEVRPDGENLANFLALLSPEELAGFAAFTVRHLGFKPSIRVDKLTAEILIEEERSGALRNIADVGFGYAEVLPLLALLWSTSVREPGPKRRRASLVALEQPELHLHPAHQARLAPMLVGACNESRARGVRFMVETHSEALVNGLGRLIRDGQIGAGDVQIIIFDRGEETGETKIQIAGYRDDGALEHWPYGFLAPVAERLRDRFAAASRK